jgi:hypothetical protein
MKKYKLLKDLPDLKAGAIFEYFDEFKPDNPWYRVKTIISPTETEFSSSQYTLKFLKDETEWFEEVQELKYTDSDMREFAVYVGNSFGRYDEMLECWLENKNRK